MTTTTKELGNIFRQNRESKELSVHRVSRDCRIHPDVIVDIENGVFDRLTKLYIKSFMKKYSDYLQLDTTDIMNKFDSFSNAVSSLGFDLGSGGANPERKEKSLEIDQKKMRVIFIVILSIVLFFSFLLLVRSLKAKFSSSGNVPINTISSDNIRSSSVPEKSGQFNMISKNARRSGTYNLSLKAVGEVWMQVKSDDKVIFAGVLKAGESKNWNSDKNITIWTGKAERLKFFLNNNNLGIIANGVVKNIKVTPEGIKIGSSWIFNLE